MSVVACHQAGINLLKRCIQVPRKEAYFTVMSVTQRKLQTPGNAEEHKKQEIPTINPIGPTDKPHRPSTKPVMSVTTAADKIVAI